MRDVPLAQARELVQRAVDKCEQLGLRGGIAVVGASGALVTASRLDRGGPGGMARATSKAWISATQQIPSAEHLQRMTTLPPPISNGFVLASPQALFPGAGGMPLFDADGVVIGGIAASGATVSPFLPTGVAPEVVSAEGKPANPEDLLIAYALGVTYVGQHGDDAARWAARFGDLVVAPENSLGMAPAPKASKQAELTWARDVCDRVLAAASARGLRVSRHGGRRGGDPIQQDRRDDAVAASVESRSRLLPPPRVSGARARKSQAIREATTSLARCILRRSSRPLAACHWSRTVMSSVASAVGGPRPRERAQTSLRAESGNAVVTEPIRIAVLGCGAIGSLYAAHLARNEGVEVWAVDPWVEHVAAIEGERASGDRSCRVRCASSCHRRSWRAAALSVRDRRD